MNNELMQRIEERSIPEPNSGCWLWLKYIMPSIGLTIRSSRGNPEVTAAQFGVSESLVNKIRYGKNWKWL